ncbi:hypothetical protein ATY81_09305 [Rhizobium sp. R72]|uniref:hypothetical protein n=1 Tax=unclassified Rhizobium TaxID=2613769 RepID=UPI000B529CC5|nr:MULTISPECIES: hypothetical protein [unclassified Rhizobium]OWV86593.1 hypothetical protein ATY79_07120 [Rhizobium sp. R693]OWV95372.1 hypothetical protein ATY81_09305 [Rhizobium sp. R72]OWV95672.1 hypothetical protein ATY80_09305 [Rhizobium sp. R711]
MTVLVGTIAASTAAAAFETLRIPQRVSASTAAKEARRAADRQTRAASGQDVEEPSNIIQSTEVALDLMTMGQKQPQAGLKQALELYSDS